MRPGSSGSDSTSFDGFAVGGERVGGIGEAAAVLDDLADAIDGVQEVAGLDAAGRRRREREVAGVLEDPVERGAGGEHARPAVVLAERREARRRPRSGAEAG